MPIAIKMSQILQRLREKLALHKTQKLMTFAGLVLMNIPQGTTLFYGNMLTYGNSYLQVVVGEDPQNVASGALSLYMVFWVIGMAGAKLVGNRLPRRFALAVGFIVYDLCLVSCYWGVQHSGAWLIVMLGMMIGLATGQSRAVSYDYFLEWFSKSNTGFLDAVSTNTAPGGVIINFIITAYANPENLTPDVDGQTAKYFRDEKVLDRVPSMFLLLAGINSLFHVFGFLLIRENPEFNSYQVTNQSQDVEKAALLSPCTDDNESGDEYLRQAKGKELVSGLRYTHGAANNAKMKRLTWKVDYEYSIDSVSSSSSSTEGSEEENEKLNCEKENSMNVFKNKEGGSVSSTEIEYIMKNGSVMLNTEQNCDTMNECNTDDDNNTRETSVDFKTSPNEIKKCDKVYVNGKTFPQSKTNSNNKVKSDEKTSSNEQLHLNGKLDSNEERSPIRNLHCKEKKNSNGTLHCNGSAKTQSSVMDSRTSDSCVSSHNGDIDQNAVATKTADSQHQQSGQNSVSSTSPLLRRRDYSVKEALCSREFYLIWLVGGMGQLHLITVSVAYKPFGQLYIADDHFLLLIATMAVASTLPARLLWGLSFDRLTLKTNFALTLSATSIFFSLFYVQPQISKWLYLVGTCLCFSGTIGLYSMVPFGLYRLLGSKHFTTLYGLACTLGLALSTAFPIVLSVLLHYTSWFGIFILNAGLDFVVLLLFLCFFPQDHKQQ